MSNKVMIDLLNQSFNEKEVYKTILFFQTDDLKTKMEDAFRYEDLKKPSAYQKTDENLVNYLEGNKVAIVELTDCKDILAEVQRVEHLFPHDVKVVIVGLENSISTLRTLSEKGFDYLFWPVEKAELSGFLRNIVTAEVKGRSIKKRSGKKIAIWGSKGGVGASLFSVELARSLADIRSSCVLVDYDFQGGDLDILLGLKKFKKRDLGLSVTNDGIDTRYAQELAVSVKDKLSLLSVTSQEVADAELKTYVQSLAKELNFTSNFVIEDLPSGVVSNDDLEYVATSFDSIIMLVEPTMTGIRETLRMKKRLLEKASTARVIIVLNQSRPYRVKALTLEDVDKHLTQEVDVVCDYEPKIEFDVLRGDALFDNKYRFSKSVRYVRSVLLGEVFDEKNGLFQRFNRRELS